jgi:TolA-binding protein
MKAQERHHLKQNEFAETTARVVAYLQANRTRVVGIAVAAVVVLAAGAGYFFWQKRQSNVAGALYGEASAVLQAQIAPAPTVPGAKQAAGTYPTELARNEAALAAFEKVVQAYPATRAGLAARYQVGALQLGLGKPADAEQTFDQVIAAGGSSLYVAMAKLGRAEALAAQNKFDDGIKILTDLSGERDSALPIDGVLMELARICEKAGKAQEARAAYKRVVDEFPESGYVPEARQQLASLG